MVTTATVRMPISLATSATTGAAPVPVPPPMPAVMNSMSAPWIISAMRSRSSMRGCAADFRVGAGAQPLGDVRAQLQLVSGLAAFQRLGIGVGADELHAVQPAADHVIHRVAAAAAHADHLDHRFLCLCYP